MKYLLLMLLLTSCATTAPDAPRLSVKPVVAKVLQCPEPIISNMSGGPFEQIDATTFNFAKKRCAALFQQSPCLVKFIMYNDDGYGVICGKEKE